MLLSVKFLLKVFFAFVFLFLYCEYCIYYIVINQCNWPELDPKNEDAEIEKSDEVPVRIMVIADTHLLGPRKGHWFDKLRREWQMYRAFQTAVTLLNPELVFILGDILDEGFYCSPQEFQKYLNRFEKMFTIPEHIKLYMVPGNHDIGFHYEITPYRISRFAESFNATAVQFITLRGIHFVLVNSMALAGDGCFFCKPVEMQLTNIERVLKCSRSFSNSECNSVSRLEAYSKPILMQHFPLYRQSDMECNDFDSAPMPLKEERFRENWECLSQEATYQLLNQIKPRLSLSGHTHHGCTRKLPFGNGIEITVPSFSWRNKNNPTIGLGVFTSNNFSFTKCPIPQESTVILLYIGGVIAIFAWVLYTFLQSKRKAASNRIKCKPELVGYDLTYSISTNL